MIITENKFINDMIDIKEYWEKQENTDDKMMGMLFSILVYFDGCSTINDCQQVKLISNGKQINNNGEMHDKLYQILDERKGE